MSLIVHIRKRLHNFELISDFETDGQLALLGASGSGKSMTLKCIAGIEKPDSGYIELNGRVLYDSSKHINIQPQKRNVGYLFQNYALFPNMTVKKNILVAMKAENKTEKLNSLLDEFYIRDIQDKYPGEISGGQQQRVALARILASEPEVILLDEPFSALDNFIRWRLEMTVADTIKKFGVISVMVTHDRDEAYRNCEAVCIINDGKSEPVLEIHKMMGQPNTIGAARISGCKNIFEAEKTNDKNVILLPKLNIYLKSAENAEEDIKAVGLRSHYFSFEVTENKIDCVVERLVEDVFGAIIMLKPINAEEGNLIRVDTDKNMLEKLSAGDNISIYIKPVDVLLLK